MKITYLICLFSFLSASSLYAQGDNGLPEVNRDRWEVGMDLIWLLKDYEHPTVFIRKNIIRQKSNDFGFRRNAYRGSFSFHSNNEISHKLDTVDADGRPFLRDISINSLRLRGGYEWQDSHKSGIIVYYGADLFMGLYASKRQFYFYNMNTSNPTGTQIYKNYSAGVIPFIGLKYPITKNFMASIESNLYLDYSYVQGQTDPNQKNIIKSGSVHASFLPVRMIAISYLF